MNDFFYDGQIRRILVQFMRTFSFLRYQVGPDANGVYTENKVPIIQGDMSRQAAHILNGGSENAALPGNMMSCFITDIEMAPNRRQNPSHESQVNIVEQEKNPDGSYNRDVPGNKYTIDRYMPVPFDLSIQLDITTSDMTTKMQLMEQILTVFNPDIIIQQNDNLIDWSRLVSIKLDSIIWSNRSIGSQTTQEKDIATLKFKVPIWINPPAKVKQQKLIESIHGAIIMAASVDAEQLNNWHDPVRSLYDFKQDEECVLYGSTQHNVSIGLEGMCDDTARLENLNGTPGDWNDVLGQLNSSADYMLTVSLDINDEIHTVHSQIKPHPTKKDIALMVVDIDSLPTVTVAVVDSIIDPLRRYPGEGLPAVRSGQRYIITADIPLGEISPWGDVGGQARAGDIIEYTNGRWQVVFISDLASGIEFTKTLDKQQHLKYANNTWSYTYYSEYGPESWKILQK